MIKGLKLVICTPAGRRRYMELLARHVLREYAVDEWRLWQNTEDPDDVAWMDTLSARERRVTVAKPTWPTEGNYSIHRFFKGCTDNDTVYVRADDDIVWCEPRAFFKLASERVTNPQPFLTYGSVINSGLTSHLHQRAGRVSWSRGLVGYACMDPVGWGDPGFALELHRTFLADPDPEKWRLPDWRLFHYERHSINVISWLGRDAATWADRMDRDEEQWLSEVRPRELDRPSLIYGGAIFAHYAFFTQRVAVDAAPDILEGYRRLAGV